MLCSSGMFSNTVACINVDNRKSIKECADLAKEIPSRIQKVLTGFLAEYDTIRET